MVAGGALEPPPRGDGVCVHAAAMRANRLAVRVGPPDATERLVSLFLATLVDIAELEGPGFCREKEMLGHCHYLRCVCTRDSDRLSSCQGQKHAI